ncbi:MAG: hypothetical protein WCL61_03920 [bacterium]
MTEAVATTTEVLEVLTVHQKDRRGSRDYLPITGKLVINMYPKEVNPEEIEEISVTNPTSLNGARMELHRANGIILSLNFVRLTMGLRGTVYAYVGTDTANTQWTIVTNKLTSDGVKNGGPNMFVLTSERQRLQYHQTPIRAGNPADRMALSSVSARASLIGEQRELYITQNPNPIYPGNTNR